MNKGISWVSLPSLAARRPPSAPRVADGAKSGSGDPSAEGGRACSAETEVGDRLPGAALGPSREQHHAFYPSADGEVRMHRTFRGRQLLRAPEAQLADR